MALIGRPHYQSQGGGDVGSIVNWYKQKLASVEEGLDEAIEQFAEDGAAMMRHNIETRGTAKGGDDPSNPGRISTGAMRDDVKARFNPRTQGGNAFGRFGWIDRKQGYYAFQEGGFQHGGGSQVDVTSSGPTGVHVEGMYALVDAYEVAEMEFRENARRALKNA